MKVGLLDVNMLIALAWPSHVHHNAAHAWMKRNRSAAWASCPITQCAFVRISSNPRIIDGAVTPCEAQAALRQMVSRKGHVFWEDDIPFSHEALPKDLLIGHRQVTDAYLLGLCIRRKGKLITFDRGVLELLPSGSPHRSAAEIVRG